MARLINNSILTIGTNVLIATSGSVFFIGCVSHVDSSGASFSGLSKVERLIRECKESFDPGVFRTGSNVQDVPRYPMDLSEVLTTQIIGSRWFPFSSILWVAPWDYPLPT